MPTRGLTRADLACGWAWVRRRLASILVIVALTLPFALPIVDHHGAERIPTHEHLLEGGAVPAVHSHEFERPHTHGARHPTVDALAAWLPSLTVAPSSPTTAETFFAGLVCVLMLLTVAAAHRTWPLGQPTSLVRPDGLDCAPPKAPPRQALLAV